MLYASVEVTKYELYAKAGAIQLDWHFRKSATDLLRTIFSPSQIVSLIYATTLSSAATAEEAGSVAPGPEKRLDRGPKEGYSEGKR